jgi:hypothetical protein
MRNSVTKALTIAALALAWSAIQATTLQPQPTIPATGVPAVSSPELWIVFIFGLVFLATRVVLAIRFPYPSKDQEAVFRTVLSLSAAGIAAAIPGLMKFESQVAATTISATGALAVFALVYLLNPASPRKRSGWRRPRDE